MKLYNITLVILIIILLYPMCKRDTDIINPVIRILSPYADENFSVFDEIHLIATVTDENKIEYIKVSLVREDLTPVQYFMTYYPTAKDYTIDDRYVIDDIHLESGQYFLMITAYNGFGTSNGFIRLNIEEVPRKLQEVVILTQGNGSINTYSAHVNSSIEYLFSIPGDYSSSDVSSRYHHLYFTGNFGINLQVYDLETLLPLWFVDPMINPPYHLPRNLYTDEKLLYVSFRNGFIRAYDDIGVIKFATSFSDDIEPGCVFRHGDLVIADVAEKSGHKRYVSAYYFISGAFKGEVQTGINVVSFHFLDSYRVYLTGNDNAGGCIRIFNDATVRISEPHAFSYGTITSSVAVDEDNLLIGTNDGIYWYRYDVSSLTKYCEVSHTSGLIYDDLSRQIYVIRDNAIDLYSFPFPDHTGTIVMGDSIVGAHLLYNK